MSQSTTPPQQSQGRRLNSADFTDVPFPAHLGDFEFEFATGRLTDVPLIAKAEELLPDMYVHDLDGSLRDGLLRLHPDGPIVADCSVFVQLLLAEEGNKALILGIGGSAEIMMAESSRAMHVGAFVPSCKKTADELSDFISNSAQWVYGPNAQGLYLGLVPGGPIWLSADEWKNELQLGALRELEELENQGEKRDSITSAESIKAGYLLTMIKRGDLDCSNWKYASVVSMTSSLFCLEGGIHDTGRLKITPHERDEQFFDVSDVEYRCPLTETRAALLALIPAKSRYPRSDRAGRRRRERQLGRK